MTPERCTVRLLLTALLIPAVLAVGACGGSDDDAATPTTAPGADRASAPSSTTADGNEGGGDATGDFCQRAKALEGKDDKFTAEAVADYRNLLEVAPDQVRPYLETIIAYLEAIPNGGGPDAAKKVAELSPKYATDSVRFVRYINENC